MSSERAKTPTGRLHPGQHYDLLGRYTFQIVYPVAIGLVKFSILAQYHRIFVKPKFRHVVVGFGGFVLIYTIIVVFVNAFECHIQPWRAWDVAFPKGCYDPIGNLLFHHGHQHPDRSDDHGDAFPLLMRLNLRPRRKWALFAIFLTGSLASVASIVRLHALYIYTISHDVSYDAVYVLLWSQVEANVAIISASAPSPRPLFSPIFRGSSYDDEGETAYKPYRMRGPRYRPRQKPNPDGAVELSSRDEEDRQVRGRFPTPTLPSRALTKGSSEEHILNQDANILQIVAVKQ